MLVAGGLLLILGVGLLFPAQARLADVPAAFGGDPAGFIATEITRADKVLNDYRIAVFRVFPAIIALCALALPFLDAINRLPFPRRYLCWINLVLGRNLLRRLVSMQNLKRYRGFELVRKNASLDHRCIPSSMSDSS